MEVDANTPRAAGRPWASDEHRNQVTERLAR
jgi:hypothetical protein